MDSTFPSPLLRGRTVLVAGASGGVGEGVTLGLLQQGAVVVAVGRDAARLRRVTEYAEGCGPGVLHTHVADVSDRDSSAVRRELSDRHGPFDGAVISIGNWGPPRGAGILETADEVWEAMIADNLTSHFRALRAVSPLLAPNGALVHLSGLSAELPYPGAALVGATNAAKKSLLRSLTAELAGRGPRVYELVIGPVRTRPRAALGADDPAWLTAVELGDHAGRLIAGQVPWADQPLQYLIDRASGVHTTVPF